MLKDKIIFITGAGQGIGRGIAEAVAEANGDVVATDINLELGEETARLVEKKGRRGLPLSVDVTNGESIQSAVEQAKVEFGRIDGLVNNAGVIVMDDALEATREDELFQYDVNVHGLLACSRIVAREFIGQGNGGAIVNLASNAGKVGYPGMVAYNASKAAVINITRSLSMEWAPHDINVNAVCPGAVNTPMLRAAATRFEGDPDEVVKTMHARQMDRLIDPIEVGRVIAFLLSDQAVIIRGQSINVDGGDTPY